MFSSPQALPQCGSVPCISLISHAIMNGTINGTTADLLMYSLAFITEPTLPIINETLKVAKLNRTRPALLSLSTQIYNFYQKNQVGLFVSSHCTWFPWQLPLHHLPYSTTEPEPSNSFYTLCFKQILFLKFISVYFLNWYRLCRSKFYQG